MVPVCTFTAPTCLKFLVVNLLIYGLTPAIISQRLGSVSKDVGFNLSQACGRHDCWFRINVHLRTDVFLERSRGRGSMAVCSWHWGPRGSALGRKGELLFILYCSVTLHCWIELSVNQALFWMWDQVSCSITVHEENSVYCAISCCS